MDVVNEICGHVVMIGGGTHVFRYHEQWGGDVLPGEEMTAGDEALLGEVLVSKEERRNKVL
jgi:hypothetical protein